ncbi:hypothetical protein [Photorhabdus bodei]|uniref:Uncharacterized protein n=1 Tax=Photorhabdus bodei TaxID=2029681 RepID=A0AAW6BGV6_9GAMM|nr:hypothetical protein [Photorhabdus bodei]MDB6367386.1 hypothetical protein [Photorhabdus bodei]MDB6371079.1 hypothetical protein [Photorhabdus bodei]
MSECSQQRGNLKDDGYSNSCLLPIYLSTINSMIKVTHISL